MASDVITVVEEEGFVSIKQDWRKWEDREDLFDHVVTKDIDFIIGFINQVEKAKIPTLAALFVKRPDAVNQVLNNVHYNDNDLLNLTKYRAELAESPDNFFNVIGKIKDPRNQERIVGRGVINLFKAKKHDSAFP